MKRLSVVIPGYKTPHVWWKRCVHSVCLATNVNDEIILVDDGCNDTYLDELAKQDHRIQVIHRENGGLSVARNTALGVAQGQYVTFVDSDDEVSTTVYQECIEQLESHRADVAVFGVKVIWPEDGLMKVDLPETKYYGALYPEVVLELSSKCLLNYAWNKVYRRSFLEKSRLRFEPRGMPCEDIVFNLNAIMSKAKWCSVATEGYIYYRTRGTLLSQYRPFNETGLRLGIETWKLYCATSDEAEVLFHQHYDQGEAALLWATWDNLWRLNSPYTLRMKYDFLKKNKGVLKISPFQILVKFLIFKILRRCFYLRPIRRWHLKRLYLHAVDYKEYSY